MRDLSLGTILWSALIAGVLAGLAAATFHFLATEPVIDHAIALETLHRQVEGTYQEPMVSRELQKVGLFVGFLIYGFTWSLLFGAVFHVTQRWLPGTSPLKRGAFLAGAALWSVALYPFLKYPANPPGVGEPDTITYRQTLYLVVLGMSVLGTALAIAIARSRNRGWRQGAAFLAVYAVAVYFLLPSNPDAIQTPTDILWRFRGLSALGLAVFWAALGVTFGLLLQRHDARVALRARPSVV
ncbi:MAG TPA: CbtA family protein [Chloroflexota bacterium]|jgi:predicted cobalt transporter CbtA